MIRAFDAFSLPLLRWFDPEDAHRMAIQGLRLLPPVKPRADDPKLAVRAFGLNFPNPIGMAAGFDKSAEVPDALLRLGFGFVEIGTVTPKPQGGNPRPRLFRLERDEAVINRMGFNNDGAEAVLRRLAARAHQGGIVGVNVGANKDSSDRVADYVRLIEIFAPVASYFTVNVSSPNTPGLRNLQQSGGARRSARQGDRCARAGAQERRRFPGAAQDRAGSQSRRTRRRRADRALAPRRRHDRRQHHAGAALDLARTGARERAGRIVGPAAVSAVDADGGGNLCARRGRVSADRRRRHRFRRRRADENPRRRQPDPALFVAGLQGPRPGRRHQERSRLDLAAHRPRLAVGNRRRRCRDDHGRGLAGEV